MYKPVNRNQNDSLLEQIADLIIELANQQEQIRLKQSSPVDPISTIRRLYEKHRETEKRLNELRQAHLVMQSAANSDFKVKNNKSLEIISRNPSKPLFQRTQQIINHKQYRILNARLQKQSLQENNVLKSNRNNNAPGDFKEFHKKNQDWEEKRKQKINMKKVQMLSKAYDEVKPKPDLGSKTNQILSKKGNFYKKDVLTRFDQYNKISREEKAAVKKSIYQREAPFKPNLTQKTKLLASLSFTSLHKGKNVFDRVSKSPSSKCLRHEDMGYEAVFNRTDKSPLKNAKQSRRTQQTQLHQVTFSTPRSYEKSSPRVRAGQTPTRTRTPILKAPILKKIHMKTEVSPSGDLETQRTHKVMFAEPSPQSAREYNRAQTHRPELNIKMEDLHSIVYSNKQQIIDFVKHLIASQRSAR